MHPGRSCDWCRGPLPEGARRDAVTCSQSCRQARHRFRTGVGVAPGVARGPALRLAYAGPPYPGDARKYYGTHPDYAGEVDHGALIEHLSAGYDGWALSTSARALPDVLALCPSGVRVAAWHRGVQPAPSRGPQNAWEPVLYLGGRRVVRSVAERRFDSLVYHAGVRRTDPARVVGAKPAAFSRWVFDLLGALPGDEFVDVFPGSGGVGRAWLAYCPESAPKALS